ncbi:MAG TPA: hypothetical protein VML55_16955 [Planctomycetaceae bacterium]|nr:hypothetical protein [Planctomycetaceae bacterium]
MGLDWQAHCAPTWERSWLRGVARLAQPTLFTNKMPELERTLRAKPLEACTFTVGSEYILRVEGSQINVFDGLTQIGFIADAPETVLGVIRDSGCGLAWGIVRRVYEYTRSADLAVN